MRKSLPLLCLLAVVHAVAAAAAPAGTLGLSVQTRFDPDEASHLGDLILVDVWEGGPAAAAGLQKGDVIVAIDGVQVAGKPREAFQEPLHGAIGGKVHLTLIRPADAMHRLEVDLTRAAFPLRHNPRFETFGYAVSRAWRLESYLFPLPWVPKLDYQGVEDVLFAPDFDDHAAAGYHSLVWVWWVDGRPVVDAAMLQATLLDYFRGLSIERGTNNHFTPDLAKVTASVAAAVPHAASGKKAARAFEGEVVTYNPQGELITLLVDADAPQCADPSHTALLFRLSTRPRQDAIWKDLRAVTGSFRCRRG